MKASGNLQFSQFYILLLSHKAKGLALPSDNQEISKGDAINCVSTGVKKTNLFHFQIRVLLHSHILKFPYSQIFKFPHPHILIFSNFHILTLRGFGRLTHLRAGIFKFSHLHILTFSHSHISTLTR